MKAILDGVSDDFRVTLLDDIEQLMIFSDSHSLASCTCISVEYPLSHHVDSENILDPEEVNENVHYCALEMHSKEFERVMKKAFDVSSPLKEITTFHGLQLKDRR